MNNITVIIHTRNEEKNIQECIDSAKLLTDQIINVDMESTDSTVAIAKKNGITITSFPYSSYVEPARTFGIKQVKTDWLLILDADERMTKELAQEIRNIVASNETPTTHWEKSPVPTHFSVARKNIFGKKNWLRHGGWWPDRQIRLIKKSSFISWPSQIHSTPRFDGQCGELQNPLLHYFHGDIHKMVEKTLLFEDIESNLLYEANKKVTIFTFFRKFFGELYRRLIKHRGFMDGTVGIIECIYQAYSKTITYHFLYEKKYIRDSKKSGSL